MAIWRFSVKGKVVRHGGRQRRQLTRNGCNEPFRDRFWCPKQRWFVKEPCPFINQRECRNFDLMCGGRMARM